MRKLAFLELSHIFANQVKLPYSTGCIWSYCRTIDEISNNFSFDLHDWFYVLDGEFDVSVTAEKLAKHDVVGVSYFVWNTFISDKVCAEIKKISTDIAKKYEMSWSFHCGTSHDVADHTC